VAPRFGPRFGLLNGGSVILKELSRGLQESRLYSRGPASDYVTGAMR